MSDIPLAYEQWAPADGRWSPWVKPVLFHPRNWSLRLQAVGSLPEVDASWAPPADGSLGEMAISLKSLDNLIDAFLHY